jgi:hypothetical protein
MIFARLNAVTGLLSDIRQGAQQFSDDVLLSAMPTGALGTQYTYDAVNKRAVAVARRAPRSLFNIRADLLALTAAQKANVNTDLFGGSPAKWTQDAGANAATLYAIWCSSQVSGLSAADATTLKLAATACYVQDNPKYLVNPAFDPSINVPGDQLA